VTCRDAEEPAIDALVVEQSLVRSSFTSPEGYLNEKIEAGARVDEGRSRLRVRELSYDVAGRRGKGSRVQVLAVRRTMAVLGVRCENLLVV
jgi:hypothetical protein